MPGPPLAESRRARHRRTVATCWTSSASPTCAIGEDDVTATPLEAWSGSGPVNSSCPRSPTTRSCGAIRRWSRGTSPSPPACPARSHRRRPGRPRRRPPGPRRRRRDPRPRQGAGPPAVRPALTDGAGSGGPVGERVDHRPDVLAERVQHRAGAAPADVLATFSRHSSGLRRPSAAGRSRPARAWRQPPPARVSPAR